MAAVAFLAAGSVGPRGMGVPGGQLWAGRPARPIRPLTEKDFRMMAKGAPHYVDLGREYRGG